MAQLTVLLHADQVALIDRWRRCPEDPADELSRSGAVRHMVDIFLEIFLDAYGDGDEDRASLAIVRDRIALLFRTRKNPPDLLHRIAERYGDKHV